jgi:hypothetical protein
MPRKKPTSSSTQAVTPKSDLGSFLATLDHPRKKEIFALRKIISGVDPTIGEDIKWNAPSFHTTEHFATFHPRHTDGVQLVLHLGAEPVDPGRSPPCPADQPPSLGDPTHLASKRLRGHADQAIGNGCGSSVAA